MMNKTEIRKAIRMIKAHEKYIAKERDKLDQSISELEMLRECCDEAHDHLARARDHLSELV